MSLPFPVLYEDDDLLAINKPPNIHSVMLSASSSMGPSVAEHLASHYPELVEVADKPEDSGLVHRLDFQTSGVLVAAKNKGAWNLMRDASRKRLIEKGYVLFVEGQWSIEGTVEAFLASRGRRAKKVHYQKTSRASPGSRVQAASTRFRLLHYFADANVSLLEATINEGRRHQIRAVSAGLGHPLLGDVLYGARGRLSSLTSGDAAGSLPDFFLHAATFSLPHPTSGTRITVLAPLPEYSSAITVGTPGLFASIVRQAQEK